MHEIFSILTVAQVCHELFGLKSKAGVIDSKVRNGLKAVCSTQQRMGDQSHEHKKAEVLNEK